MRTVRLSELTGGADWIGLGIAGNQAGHLNQAGEEDDFKDVIADENAPKGIFPWYVSNSDSFLNVNPLSSDLIQLRGENRIQPEPEIALIVQFDYTASDSLESVSVRGFTVFNDCSRRVEAAKISHKKNWGTCSKGMPDGQIITIDDFTTEGGVIDQYRLCCYVERDGKLIQYGEDTAVSDYCYLNTQLLDWVKNQINTQQDSGPLESIGDLISENKPTYGVIAIGATCYTEFGNSDERFLRVNDRLIVTAYDASKQSKEGVEVLLDKKNSSNEEGVLILDQQVMK